MYKRLLSAALALALALAGMSIPVFPVSGEPASTSTIGVEPGYANELQPGDTGYQSSYHTYTFPEVTVSQPGETLLHSVVIQFSRAIQSGDAIQAIDPGAAGITSVSAGGWVTNCVLTSKNGLTAAQWQDYLRQNLQVRLTNNSAVVRSLRFSVSTEEMDAVYHYNEDNGHSYLAVPQSLSWTEALAQAAKKSYLGRQGYLTTVTSQEEQDFVFSLMGVDCWIGATCMEDYTGHPGSFAADKADYYWVDGPEAGQLLWSGAYGQVDPNTGSSPKMYTNWYPKEPNNGDPSSPENCVQLFATRGGTWNDIPSTTALPYIAEFGGMPDDIEGSSTTASTTDVALDINGKTLGVNCPNVTYGETVTPGTTVNGQPFAEEVTYTYYQKQADGSYLELAGPPTGAGSYKVAVTKPDDASYTGSSKAFTIYPKTITASDLTVSPTVKPYDGTTQFLGSIAIGNAEEGDQVSVSYDTSSGYNSADVADANTLTFTNLTLTGADAANYTLAPTVLETAGSITPREMRVGPTATPAEKRVGEAVPLYGVQWLAAPDSRAADPFNRPVSDLGAPQFTCQNGQETELTATSPAGTYLLRLTGFQGADGSLWENPNYTIEIVNPATVVVTQDQGQYQITGARKNDSGWFTGPVTVAPTAQSDYRQIADLLANPLTWGGSLSLTGDGAHPLQVQLRQESTGAVTQPASETVKIDSTAPVLAPERDITVSYRDGKDHPALPGNGGFAQLYNTPIDLVVRASDATSGLAHIEHLLYPTADPTDPYTPAADAPWVCDLTPAEDGSIAIPFTGDFRGLVFLRATDVAGNQTLVSYPLLVDLTPPVIAGVQNGGEYYVQKTVTVTDSNLDRVYVVQNGISIGQFTPQQVGGSVNLTLPATGESTEYTLVAVDLAGNLTEYKVTTQPVSDIPAPIEGVTPDNVSGDHRADIESVKEKAEEIHRDPDATPAQKEELQEIIDRCDGLLDELDRVKGEIEDAKRPEGGEGALQPDQVDKDNKGDAQQVVDQIKDLIDKEGDHLGDSQREELEDLRDQLEEAIEQVEEVEALEEAVRQLPDDLSQADPDALADLRERYSQLNDRQREMMDPQLKAKLLGGNTADTGDHAAPVLWGLLAAGSALALAAAHKRRHDA